ncbi:MAG TPA: DUF2142 domain-containing protein, partial [Acidimicrobiales bacterium]|nr:DUF2142 domain-containing protein [Acidimicrobiales bacterium]
MFSGQGGGDAQAEGPGTTGPAPRRLRFGLIWLLASAISFALAMCWVIATPVGGGPDEPTQMVKAAATVRGELIGSDVRGTSTAMRRMVVPQAYAHATEIAGCFQFQPDKRANCQPEWSGTMSPTHVDTYVGRYPPLYYLAVGLPTLVTPSVWGFYAMRTISALICATLIGLAFAVAGVYGRARLVVIGAAVCVTPMVAFLSATINASSMEMAAAFCMWAAALVLVLDHVEDPPRPVVVTLFASGAVLALSRSISPLWVGCVLGIMFLLDPRGIVALLRHRGPTRRAVLGLVAVCAFAGLYALAAKSFSVYPAGKPVPAGASTWRIVTLAWDRIPGYYRQFIGVFGWLDTKSPPISMWIWTLLLILTVLAGLVSGSWRQRLCMVLIGIGIVTIPTAITTSHARVDGLVWQSRYSYPIDVGLLLLAAAVTSRGALANRHVVRVVAILAVAAMAVAHLASYFQTLRRYVVGYHGTPHFLSNHRGQWEPPLPPYV